MRNRTSLSRVLGLAFVLGAYLLGAYLFLGGPILAQVRIAREAIVDTTEITTILGVGQQLETQKRWGEALSHYEEALRRHPHSPNLLQRHFLARLHYDVGRRYNDPSFMSVLAELNAQRALDLYSEILLKINTYYVDRPDWAELVRRGTAAMEVAFAEESFRDQHGLAHSGDRLAAYTNFLSDIRRSLDQRKVRSHHEAQQLVTQAAYAAEQQIGIPARIVILEYACAAASSLDDYSSFLTGSQLDDVLSQIEGNFVGLGIELKAVSNSLLIVDVILGGPADHSGIRPGEMIVSVDGHSTKEVSTDVAADMLKGVEGSFVELIVEDSQGRARDVTLTRMRVDVPSVERASIVDRQVGIAYLQLTSFQKRTSRDVEDTLWSLHRQGMRSLILDLRGNPGGLLSVAVEVADKFVSGGGIVSTRGRSRSEVRDYEAHYAGTWRVPLVVLIDGDSASASEIFAGAIRDHRRGVIVGHRSFGKGSVQGIFPLNSANIGVRLTTAKFYSPKGQAISRRGVEPDVPVPVDAEARVRAPHFTARVTDEGQFPQVDHQDAALNAGLLVARERLGER
jgi:carboxyl-terminal processing protease